MRTLLCWLVLAAAASAQPRLVNGKLETRASKGVESEVRAFASAQTAPAWIGYAVPMVAGRQDSCGQVLTLDEGTRSAPESRRVSLEGNRTLLVFLRAANGQVNRVRSFSADCEVDAGGHSVAFLTGVRAEESINLLSPLADGADRSLMNAAILAVSLHAGSAADDALIGLARNGKHAEVRSQALFWLAQKASSKAAGVIADALRDDPDTEVKKRAVFALSQLPKDEGIPRLIEVARGNRNMEVRKQAFFWLGQSKDPRALTFFEQVLTGR